MKRGERMTEDGEETEYEPEKGAQRKILSVRLERDSCEDDKGEKKRSSEK